MSNNCISDFTCEIDNDCNYGKGKCMDGTCVCNPGWKPYDCYGNSYFVLSLVSHQKLMHLIDLM